MRKKRATSRGSNNAPQKIRKRQKVTLYSKFLAWILKQRLIFGVVTGIIVVAVLISAGLKKTFLAPRYSLQELRYDPASIAVYDDPLLYELLNETIIGMNFFAFKRMKKNTIINTLKKDYPLIKEIDIRMQDDQIAFVSIMYHDPAIVFQLPENRRYASYKESLYPLGTGDSLGQDSLVIELPRYTAELPNIEGVYYRLSEERLFTVVTKIVDALGPSSIAELIYLPGGEKLFLGYNAKRLYFHLNKDIDIQLQKLADIEENFTGYPNVTVLDLGSSDDTIVRY